MLSVSQMLFLELIMFLLLLLGTHQCNAAKMRTTTNNKVSCKIIHIEDIHSDQWRLSEVADLLNNNAVGIIPTDTCYSFVTRIDNKEGINKILRLKNEGIKKPLSVLCKDIATISAYSSNLVDQKWVFKLLKSCLPGPFTVILPSSKAVPTILTEHKKHMRRWKRQEIGVRIPDDEICSFISANLDGVPLVAGSVPEYGEDEDISSYASLGLAEGDDNDEPNAEEAEYSIDTDADNKAFMTQPLSSDGEQAWVSRWQREVDFIIECGDRGDKGRSTVVDLTSGAPVILRKGMGLLDVEQFRV